jgi:phage host-nuclease inhibitor protein Gam
MVADDIFGAGKVINEEQFFNNIKRKIELGVIDENIVASELQAVLREIKDTRGITSLDKLIRSLSEGKFAMNDEFAANVGQKLSNFGKTATRVYAGGDNLWKWYGHTYVTAQLRPLFNNLDDVGKWYKEIVGREFMKRNNFGVNAGKLKTLDEATEEAAAWYIRNTYPTYSKVPEVIQNLRKLPFGNFVSFPAEMIRTTFNILTVGAKEATSANPKLRQMGLRRLLGAYTVLGGASKGALGLASGLSGVTIEQLEAYKRSLAAPWNSRATILPINKWKDGVGKAVNFSYFSPYDAPYIPAPVAAAPNAVCKNPGSGICAVCVPDPAIPPMIPVTRLPYCCNCSCG